MSPSKPWHDINHLGGLPTGLEKRDDAPKKSRPVADDPVVKQPEAPEVELKSATWEKGKEGFGFNKECLLVVTAEFLERTTARKIYAKLFATTESEEEDLRWEGSGTLDDDGRAEINIKLWYPEKYYKLKDQNPNLKCKYYCKVHHSRGVKELNSEYLEMPNDDGEAFGVSA
jgi:hypothetical protein